MHKKKLRQISLLLFFTFLLNLCVPCFSVQAEVIFLSDAPIEKGIFSASEDSGVKEVSFGDTAGHWAENGIKAWAARELVGGYPDGTFRPDSPITRAEFLTLVNRAFGYTAAGQGAGGMNTAVDSSGSFWGAYKDIAVTDWYAGEIAKAAAVGYLGGYPDGTVKPQNPITRQEAAALFAKILPPANFGKDKNKDSNNDTVDSLSDTKVKFVDQAQIPAWSQAAIAAAVSGGYMNGYPDGTFQPAKPITRAEAVASLERAVGTLYNRAGTYGPFQGTALLEGNVTVNTPGVTLQNTTITGNLYLTEGIGAGDVTLDNVTVQGTTKISGGGSNSIHLLNTTIGAVLVNVPSRHLVRLLAQGSTDVGTLEARTPAKLEEEGLTGSGFTKVIVKTSKNLAGVILAEGSNTPQSPTINVELLGQFSDVEIQAAAAQLDLQKGSIANLTLSSTAQAAQINLAAQTSINTLTADTPATVQGQGTVETTQANVDGVVIEAPAKKVFLADGVQANVAGKTITEDYKYVEPKKKKSRDAALSDLMIDGITVAGFAPDTLSYDVVLPYGTTEEEIPTVTAEAHHAKARITITPATTLPGSTTVLVTAESGKTQTYTVSFTVAENFAKKITSFKFEGFDPDVMGTINEEAKTIVLTVPYETDVAALTPTITYIGASISPDSGVEQDFTNPVIYTVTAEDDTTQAYTVTVSKAAAVDAVIDIAAIAGVTAPVRDAAPVATITETAQYTGTVSWSPEIADNKFAASTVYTATITLSPKAGYTLTGITENFFTVEGATATNAADSGVITAVFPATEAVPDTVIDIAAIAGVTAPVRDAAPVATITETDQYTGTVSWSPEIADNKFAASTVYTATITLSPKAGYTLTGITENFFTVEGATATNAADSGVITAVFPATEAVPDTVIDIAAIAGVTAPVRDAAPVATITETAQYTGTVSWSPEIADNKFAASTVYTATITLSPKAGYTLTGITENFFTVEGATATNAADSGVVTAVFPATEAVPDAVIDIAAIAGVTAPVRDAAPVATITETAQYTGTVSWSPEIADNKFAASTVYTATITLSPKAGYTLTGITENFFTVEGATATNAADSGVITAVFPATEAVPDAVIDIAAIAGVTAPVRDAAPVATITETDQYTGTVSWSPEIADNKFAASTVYTATITLSPKAGYTLTGITENFFTVEGATATNAADSGVVTAVFPATEAVPDAVIDIAAIAGVTAPVTEMPLR
ncbi:MAG: S-layer homology domain-containing protein [Peptococcia bacterium]